MKISGQISLPGDKSISHRALMIASLSPEKSKIINLSTGQDVKSTKKCLKNCNISINDTGKSEIIIFGDTFISPDKELDCGNSGTTIRLLSGLLPSKNIQATLFGDQSLSKRPMGRIIKPLSEMGVKIKGANEKPPLMITKSEYNSIDYKNRIPSAQVKSAVLFAGLGASGTTKFSEPFLSRNHTEIMLENIGANIKTNKNEISISRNSQKLAPLNITVPSDPSTAAFFAGAVAIIPKSNLIINNILTNPTRFGFFTSLKEMGLELDLLSEKSEAGELVSDIFIKHGELKAIEINEKQVPSLIDEIPMLAVIATQAVGKTIIRGARELRVKESDRIQSILFNLKNMGAVIEEFEDGFTITGPTKLNGTIIRTFGDHRIAMAFMIASLIATGTTKLDNYECVNISFPEFFDKLKSIIS